MTAALRDLPAPVQGHLAMLLFSGLVAGSFSLGSIVANEVSPIAITAVRFGLAAVIVGAMAAATCGFRREAAAAPWRYLVLGGLFASYFVLMFEGLKTAAPISTAAIFTLTPLMSALFGFFLLRQITTWRMALALALGAFGALWVIFDADLEALVAFQIGRGEAIFFVGCVAHAIYAPMARRLNRGEPVVLSTFGMLAAGWLLLMIYGWRDIVSTDWLQLPAIVWVTIAYLVIAASSVTFVLLQFATLRLPSAKVMAYTYLTPSWVVLWELSLGNGVPPIVIVVGVALTCSALILLLKDEH